MIIHLLKNNLFSLSLLEKGTQKGKVRERCKGARKKQREEEKLIFLINVHNTLAKVEKKMSEHENIIPQLMKDIFHCENEQKQIEKEILKSCLIIDEFRKETDAHCELVNPIGEQVKVLMAAKDFIKSDYEKYTSEQECSGEIIEEQYLHDKEFLQQKIKEINNLTTATKELLEDVKLVAEKFKKEQDA